MLCDIATYYKYLKDGKILVNKHVGKKIVVFEDELEKENIKENGL